MVSVYGWSFEFGSGDLQRAESTAHGGDGDTEYPVY